jgi:hypothetical protein
MKLKIGIAAAIGFLLPVICGFVAVLMISPRAGNFWINIALRIPYVLCPVLLLSDSSSTWWYLSPLTNAALYGVIAYLWLRVKKAYAN